MDASSEHVSVKFCPYYRDNRRLCIEKYDFILYQNTWAFCDTGRYGECPFYRLLMSEVGEACELVGSCPIFKIINIAEYRRFSDMYCLCKTHLRCARYKLKMEGRPVSFFLMPDGSFFDVENDE